MPKLRKRPMGEPAAPPGKWSPEKTIKFYERYDGDSDLMYDVVNTFFHRIKNPGAFVAKITDFVLQSTYWRSKNTDKFLEETYCGDCGRRGIDTALYIFENRAYCTKHFALRKHEN